MHVLKQNKGVHLKYEPGKDIPTGNKPSLGWEDLLSLGKEVSRPKAHFYVSKLRSKDCMLKIVFPQKYKGL